MSGFSASFLASFLASIAPNYGQGFGGQAPSGPSPITVSLTAAGTVRDAAGAVAQTLTVSLAATGTVLLQGLLAQTVTASLSSAGLASYPNSAAAMAAALGFGTWTTGAAWLCDEASGNLVPIFGSGTLVASGSPTYGVTGPRGGIDKAVRLADNTSQTFSANVFDVGATDDLILVWVGKHPAAPSGTRIFLSKRAASTAYYSVQLASGAGGGITMVMSDATNTPVSGTASSATHVADTWYVGVAVLERGVGLRVATNLATGTSTSEGALGSCSNSSGFGPGRGGSVVALADFAFLAVVKGSGVAASVNANIATAVTNFKAYCGL